MTKAEERERFNAAFAVWYDEWYHDHGSPECDSVPAALEAAFTAGWDAALCVAGVKIE